jgi:hypothetical protein
MIELSLRCAVLRGRSGNRANLSGQHTNRGRFAVRALAAWLLVELSLASAAVAQEPQPGVQTDRSPQPASQIPQSQHQLPPREIEAERFLVQHGWVPGHRLPARAIGVEIGILAGPTAQQSLPLTSAATAQPANAATNNATTASWQPLGPTAVQTPGFGLVTGRVAALALDPSDSTGNRLYLGTTGGGVWMSNNAGTSVPSSIVFNPLTDAVAALGGAASASISIGALTVQPGGTNVILAGTGDPNDVLDSYYGAGILRSTDGGNTWSLITATYDKEMGFGVQDFRFIGEGFAGFAWNTVNPQLVVAAVSQAYEGAVVEADELNWSYEGLYYSSDSGATWHLARITDGSGADVQGPLDKFVQPDGNAATAVVWNPVRQLFIAAVRYHGYYQSADGVTWTRMAAQPGSGLTASQCPTNLGSTGSIACPIYRGALAVNPQTGDTFAWTVDLNNQDQGIWQDQCAILGGSCSNPTITFGKQWSTAPLETSDLEGAATIADGTYNLVLAAVPSAQDTLVLAGANDLWKCSLAMGCAWRNTTNSTTCMSAQVGEFQHALAWNTNNPLEVFLGNDSGLWRSTDAIGETGSACSTADATHFQNLNGSLGSLAEVESLSPITSSPYYLMAGLGVNGTAGVKSTAATVDWPQILSGYGGPVAIDPIASNKWYVNNQSGVAIYACSQNSLCAPGDFGANPVVTDADVGGDGYSMPTPAPFLVDPLDDTQLLVGTCRVWRGPADGIGWSASDAISPILDSGATGVQCNGDALIRSMAAMKLPGGGEIIYVGMEGALSDGTNLPGHVLSAIVNPSSTGSPTWTDLALSPVVNDTQTFNPYGFAISSVTIDTHDPTGNTVYATVEGMKTPLEEVEVVYRSTNGGASWNAISANLPSAPANSLAVDPQNANAVYIATDQGVYFTSSVASCGQSLSNCWSTFGSGLPGAPVVAVAASQPGVSPQVLVAGTYGRGIWQSPLWSAGTSLTTAAANPATLSFSSQVFGTASSALAVTLGNTGSIALSPSSIAMSGDFSETDNCVNASLAPGTSCTIEVTFTPQATGPRSGAMTIYANVYGGRLTVDLDGTGSPAGAVSLAPATISFGQVQVGNTSTPLQVTAQNSSAAAIPISSVSITAPFVLAGNSCGAISLAASSDCQLEVEFAPTQAGAATGLLTFTDGAGTQTVELSGTGAAPPTDILSSTSLAFPATGDGQLSAAQLVTITNIGGLPLTSIAISVSAGFQQSSTCVTQLASGAVCTISVVLAPTQLGAIAGTLTIADALHTQIVALSGTGVAAPVITVNPASLNFTNQQPGVASAPQTITVSNTGGAPMANVGFQITGAAASSYSIAATSCGALLNQGSSCAVQVVFTPASCGNVAATLAISSSTLGVAAVAVSLNGSGQLSAALATNPSQLTFPVVAAGQSSSAQTVTVTNSSSYAISSVSLAAAAPFSVTQNTCTGSMAAGANCTASVAFQPSAGGAATGALTISSSAVAAQATVALSGVGFDFAVAVSGPASQTVARGQQANYTLVLTPAGSGGSFTFACGTLPTNALCLFNPTTETLSTGVQGNVLVQISTSSSATARLEGPSGDRPGGLSPNFGKSGPDRRGIWRALPLACGLFLLPLALWRRRRVFLLAVLAVLMAGSVSSCTSSGGGTTGGGSGGSGGSGGTPTGTYTIPISVTSTGMTHSVNLTLTVD